MSLRSRARMVAQSMRGGGEAKDGVTVETRANAHELRVSAIPFSPPRTARLMIGHKLFYYERKGLQLYERRVRGESTRDTPTGRQHDRMARLKPSGVRLRVWRAQLREREEARGDTSSARPAAEARGRKTNSQKARGKSCTHLRGPLEGWVKERRLTGSGRLYAVFRAPDGVQYRSESSALRYAIGSVA